MLTVLSLITPPAAAGGNWERGLYRYGFRCTIHSQPEDIHDQHTIRGWLMFEGKTPFQWKCGGPFTPKYPTVTLRWFIYTHADGAPLQNTLSFNLSTAANQNLPDTMGFAQSIGILDLDPETHAFLGYVLQLIREAGTAQLPGPRHHSYTFEQPYDTHLDHFASGFPMPTALILWWIFWALGTLYALLSRSYERT